MKNKIFLHSILTVLITFITACQPSTTEPTLFEATQEVIIPSDTPSPTSVPLTLSFSSPEWSGIPLDSICVIVDERTSDEQAGFLSPIFNQSKVIELLQDIDLKANSSSSLCDITLHIEVSYYTSNTTYTDLTTGGGTFECLTGVYFSGLMVMTAVGRPSLYIDIDEEVINSPSVIINGCPQINNLVEIGWTKSLLKGLSEFMGPYVITFLYQSNNSIYRSAALLASEAFGPEDIVVSPDVINALKTQADHTNSLQIATGIQNMGLEAQLAAQDAVPSLTKQLKSNYDLGLLDGADGYLFLLPLIEALGKLGPGAKEAVPLLTQILQDQTSLYPLGNALAQALGNIGPDAAESTPELRKLIDESYDVAEALRKIEPITPDVITALMEDAKNYEEDSFKASSALQALGELNAESADILPFLISATKYSDPNVASIAILELGKLGPISPEILPILKNALSGDETIKGAGATALGDFGPDAIETIPLLISMIENSGQYSLAKVYAVETLGRLGQASPEVISTLIVALENYTGGAAEALEQLGPPARDAVPALIKVLEVENVNPYFYESQRPYVRALIAITGEYHGFNAKDWQTWWDTQK